MDVPSARGDRRQHRLRARDREVRAVVLADAEEVDTDLVGQNPLGDHVADGLRVRHQRAAAVLGHVTEGVDPELYELIHLDSLFIRDPSSCERNRLRWNVSEVGAIPDARHYWIEGIALSGKSFDACGRTSRRVCQNQPTEPTTRQSRTSHRSARSPRGTVWLATHNDRSIIRPRRREPGTAYRHFPACPTYSVV